VEEALSFGEGLGEAFPGYRKVAGILFFVIKETDRGQCLKMQSHPATSKN